MCFILLSPPASVSFCLSKVLLLLFLSVYVGVGAREHLILHRTQIPGSCEPTDMDTGNNIWPEQWVLLTSALSPLSSTPASSWPSLCDALTAWPRSEGEGKADLPQGCG